MFHQDMIFSHHMPTRIIWGEGSLGRLPEEVAAIKRRCLLVTGRRAARLSGLLERVQECLLSARIESVLFDQVEPNPTVDTIREGVALAQDKKARWVLAVGGGSAMDAAKAIAMMAVNEGEIREFFSGARPGHPPMPVVAVPTTAGTGSEVTPFSVLTDVSECDKFGLAHPNLFPRLAILDPEVTVSMPEQVTVNSGLDVLCHAVEAIFSKKRSDLSDLYARRAIDRLATHLPVSRTEPANLEARSGMQLAAAFAGMAIADTATLVPHALGYPVTVRYDIPHGRATVLLLPAFLERMCDLEVQRPRAAYVGRVLGEEADPPKALRAFIEQLGVAPRLTAYGFQEKDIPMFVQQSLDKKHLGITPGEWGEQQLEDLYRQSL
ncbi:MAG: iron-containing alcohol dehydrogenase [Deltaproteobacteria bacterium]|nr:iron-containing alcohol dehydrogenase [Deltaproteobacteria bacterium]